MIIDPQIKSYTDDRTGQMIDAVNAHRGYRPAAAATGIPDTTIRRNVRRAQAQAVMRGYAPAHNMKHTVPPPLVIKRISTNYDKSGEVAQQWVIAEPERQAILDGAIEAIERHAANLPRMKPIKPPLHTDTSLLNLYTFTDYHLGQLSSQKESGTEWNLEMAVHALIQAFQLMISSAPKASKAFINVQGDFLHTDGILPVTPTSHNVLDASARFSDIIDATVSVLRAMVDVALAQHDIVVLSLLEGNHDINTMMVLRTAFKVLYEKEPRVEVLDSPHPYYAYEHGVTMLAFAHGHLKKKEMLPLVFASEFPQMWGRTTKRYIHCGHFHHLQEIEYSGCKVLQHPNLPPRDAYSSRHGYGSEREATAETYHLLYGRVNRNTIVPEMFRQ